MLFLPSGSLPPKQSKTGIARGRGRGLFWIRANTSAVQPRTDAQNRWRQIFAQAKRNWLAIGPGGAHNIPTNGIDPQSAWAILAASYFGILQPGYYTGNVQAQSSLVGCSTVEAFQVMVQTTLASLGLPSAAAPTITDIYLAYPGSPFSGTEGNFAVTITGDTTPNPSQPALALAMTLTTETQATPPTALTATAPNCNITIAPLTATQTPGVIFTDQPCNVTANHTNWIYTFDPPAPFPNLIGALFSATGFDNAAFNVTNQPIIFNTDETLTIANATFPEELDTGGSGTATNVTVYQYSTTINVLPALTLTAGTVPLIIGFNDNAGNHTSDLSLAATLGNTQAANPAPTFPLPNSLYSASVYDSGYHCIGFTLQYNAAGVITYPMSRNGVEIPGVWIITASNVYTSSYSPPSVSSWKVILLEGPFMPGPATLLAAWEAAYGPLPAQGDISFQVQYADPASGCPGPSLSTTARWQNGTLTSADLTGWTGPLFELNVSTDAIGGTAPGTSTLTVTVNGQNGYGGTITLSAKSETVIDNGANSSRRVMPTGATITFSPPTLTIPPGSTTPISSTLTCVLASGTTQFSGPISIQGKDGTITTGQTVTLSASGDVTPQPPPNFLTLNPIQVNKFTSYPSTITIDYTLYNTGPQEQFVVMLASYPDAAFTFAFSQVALSVPAGTLDAPGSATVTLTITTPAVATRPAGIAQIEASAGNYTTYSAINLGAPEYGGLTMSNTPTSANPASPSTTVMLFTIGSAIQAPTTVLLELSGVPSAITAELSQTTINLPGGSTDAPATATVTLTITVASGVSTLGLAFLVTATAATFAVDIIVSFD